MDLLLLVLLFAALGYILASMRSRRAEKPGRAKTGWRDRFSDSWKRTFRRGSLTDDFRGWMYGAGSASLPEDFKAWFASLPEREAQTFTQALAGYASGMGLSLSKLVSGGLDQDPVLRQVFVEAIVVYSQAYRKAKKAQQAVEQVERQGRKQPGSDGKKPVEKSAGELPVEAAEPAAGD